MFSILNVLFVFCWYLFKCKHLLYVKKQNVAQYILTSGFKTTC